jgi:DNA-binding CsgD family transcriptional regulator
MAFGPTATEVVDQLIDRELEIIRMLGEGKTVAEIAVSFGQAYKTVINYCNAIRGKLGVERNADLIRVALSLSAANGVGG